MKLKDLVLKKRELEMQGKKVNMEARQSNQFRNVEKTGTNSQK